jgi:DNA polymerase-3 subunit epsilon
LPVPPKLAESEITMLSNQPGVYCLYGVDDELLYVGKSVRIRERVRSHFRGTDESRKRKKLFEQTASIEIFRTAGDLGASLLELQHIKERQPLFNKQSRKKKQLVVAYQRRDDDGYLYPEIQRAKQIDASDECVLGVFKSKRQAKNTIETVARENALCRQRLKVGTKMTDGPCFYYQLDQCRGACIGEDKPENYNQRFRKAFADYKVQAWPFDGAVEIREADGERTDIFTVDHWVITDAITEIDEHRQNFFRSVDKPATFNYDTYKQIARKLLDGDKQTADNMSIQDE